MNKTYMLSKGNIMVQENGNKNELGWDADYDGNIANIKLNVLENNERKRQINNQQINMKLTNKDLANLLSIPSIDGPIDQRLQNDFIQERETPEIEQVLRPTYKIKRPYQYKTPPPQTLHIHLPKSVKKYRTMRHTTSKRNKTNKHNKQNKQDKQNKQNKSNKTNKSLSKFISQFVTNG
jgi:hypothetical protein